jgi:hypothetical protein
MNSEEADVSGMFRAGAEMSRRGKGGEGGAQTVEINRAGAIKVYFVDHIIELCVSGIETKGFHDGA